MVDTYGEKVKEVELQTLEREWPMCKAEALVDPLAHKLTEVDAQTSLETLVKVKTKALVVENEEALANKLTHTILQVKNDTIAYTLPEVEAEVLVVTPVDMPSEGNVQTLTKL